MRSNTLGGETIRRIKETVKLSSNAAEIIINWLMLGLSGQQWLASLLIGLLLSPVFSLPVQAANAVAANNAVAADYGDFEPVNPPSPVWEKAWMKLSVAVEEWETARRAGNEPMTVPADDKAVRKTTDEITGDEVGKPKTVKEDVSSEKSAADLPDSAAVDAESSVKDTKTADVTAKSVVPPAVPIAAPMSRALVNQLPADERNSTYAYGNNLGSPVGQTEAEAPSRTAALPIRHRAGIANFSFDVPLAGLSGRGINAGVGMTYNSRTWNKYCIEYATNGDCTQNHFTYDVEQSWLAPGFSTGFGSLETVAIINSTHRSGTSHFDYYTEIAPFGITDADGTRHQIQCSEFVPIPDSDTYRCTGYKSVDGSFIRMAPQAWVANVNNSPFNANTSTYDNAGFVASYPNGSKVYYSGGFGGGINRKHYPVILQDSNGNRIQIAYKDHQTGRIDYINDTLNRKIKFYYENDVNGNPDKLVTVTIPGMQNEELQTVRFYYQENNAFSPQTGFSGEVDAPSTLRTLQYVYFPATKTGFKYEYHPFYGMIQKITRRVGMTVSDEISKTVTGTVTSAGDWTASTEYDYPSGSPALTDAPKYSKRTDDWRGRTADVPSETFYAVTETPNSADSTSTVTVHEADFDVVTESIITGGLIRETSVKRTPGILNQPFLLMSKVRYFWSSEQCTGSCYQVANPQLIKIETTNDAGLTKATEFEYDGYNNQKKIKERDYAAPGSLGTLLRTTDIVYETDAGWINANLLGLVKEVKVTVGTAVVSKTLYEYDGNPLTARDMDTPETTGTHDYYYNPGHPATCHLTCSVEPTNRTCSGAPEPDFVEDPENPGYDVDHCIRHTTYGYSPNSDYRGNVTKIGRMLDLTANAVTTTNSDETDYTYDIAGSLVSATLSCCQLKTLDYSSETGYAFPTSETKGTSPQLTSSVVYNKYTGVVTSSTDENGQVTSYEYEQNTLRQKKVVYPNNAYSQTEYSDVLEAGSSSQQLIGYIKTTTLLDTNKTAVGYTYFDGRGATIRSATQVPGSQWSVATVEYDKFGRTVKSYNPFYAYSPNGAPPPGTAFTTVTNYDALGRTTAVKLQDDTIVSTEFSNQYTAPAGFNKSYVTVTDQAGKQRRQVMDSLGRIVRVDEPDVSAGNLGLGAANAPIQPTAYEYDGNDNLIKTIQTDGGTTQIREFKYDALSRLTHEKQVEATATLDNNGTKQTSGGLWTKVLKYTPKGLLSEGTDARGVKTTFGYDGLNRLQTVVYSNEVGYQTPTVTYTYDQPQSGFYNIGALTRVETAAVGDTPATASEFDYDLMGRVKGQRQIIGAQTYNLAYGYNLAGQLTTETYPSGKIVSTGYDANGRLASISDQSRTYLASVGYLGKGNNVNGLTLGNGTTQGFAYNDRLQLETQNLAKPNEILQQYDYTYGQKDANNALKNNGKLATVESRIGSTKQWTQKFGYDAIGRLSEAAEYRGDNDTQLSYKQKFDFDKFGNLYRKALSNPTAEQQSPLQFTPIEDTDISKATNQFTPATGTTYDDAGNVITDNKFRAMSFGYDANGRMVKATKANTPDAANIYDASGRRVAECVNEVWKFFIYDTGGKMIAEYGGIQSVDEGGVKYPLTDWQGSTRALTSNSGFVQSRSDYTAFGEEIGASVGQRTTAQGFGATNNLSQKYAQTERDQATGLDNTWFRKLENKAGRWTSPDPYNGSANIGDPQSFNRYSYVENQPTNYADPSGLNMVANIYQTCELVNDKPICSIHIFYTPSGGDSGGGTEGGSGGGNPPQNGECDPNYFDPNGSYSDPSKKIFAGTDLNFAARVIFAEAESMFEPNKSSGGTIGYSLREGSEDEFDAMASVLYNRIGVRGYPSAAYSTFYDVANAGTGEAKQFRSIGTPKFNSADEGSYQNLQTSVFGQTPRQETKPPVIVAGDCENLRAATNALRKLLQNGPRYNYTFNLGGTERATNFTVHGGSRFR